MTIQTFSFMSDKKAGKVKKIGRASFYDGMTRLERALYFNENDKEMYVMLNNEAHVFTPHVDNGVVRMVDGVTLGRI